MYYLKNPAGRIVDFDTQEQFDEYARKGGFSQPSQQEISEFVSRRTQVAEDMRIAQELAAKPSQGVHFATVSPGGTDGYGVASTALIRQLKKIGIDVRTYYDGQKVSVLFHNPYSLMSMETPYRIIYTMFESDKIPDDWIEYLKIADAVLVPSKWCQAVFAKAGIAADVVPLGYDDGVFEYAPRHEKRPQHGTFNFLHYDAFNARKGFLEVFKAFTQEFNQDEPVRLVLKTTVDNYYQRFPINMDIYKNIEIVHGKISPFELQQLIHRCDCFVFPSRGEGFGVTPLECMATGMPVIVPNAHGISEYFDDTCMYEVKVDGPSPALYSRYKGIDVGQMVTCSVSDLQKRMRWVYEHEREAIEKGKLAAEYAKHWTLSNTAVSIKRVIDKVLQSPPKMETVGGFLQLEQVT